MTLKTNLPGTFSDATLPKLYRDFAITPGAKFCFDALDVNSYPQQSAPTIGSTTWATLVDVNTDTAAFLNASGTIAFNGGFDFAATAGYPNITFPVSSKPAATSSFLQILWFKHAAPAGGSFNDILALGGSTPGTQAYAFTHDVAGAQLRCTINQVIRANTPLIVGSVYQIGLSATRQANSTYTYGVFLNGASIAAVSSVDTTIYQPVQTASAIQANNGAFKGKIYRVLHDSLTTASALSIVVADYNANAARFS